MEYVQAIDILKALRQVPPPEGPPMFVRQHIIAQLCLGLSYIHFKGDLVNILSTNSFMSKFS